MGGLPTLGFENQHPAELVLTVPPRDTLISRDHSAILLTLPWVDGVSPPKYQHRYLPVQCNRVVKLPQPVRRCRKDLAGGIEENELL